MAVEYKFAMEGKNVVERKNPEFKIKKNHSCGPHSMPIWWYFRTTNNRSFESFRSTMHFEKFCSQIRTVIILDGGWKLPQEIDKR